MLDYGRRLQLIVDVWQMDTELRSNLEGAIAAPPAATRSGTVAPQLAQQVGTLPLMTHWATTTSALDTTTSIHYIAAYATKPDLEPNSHDTDPSSNMFDMPELAPDSEFDDMPDLGLDMPLAPGPRVPLYCDG